MNAITTAAALTERQEIRGDLFTRFIEYLDAAPKTIESYTRALKQLYYYFS